MGVLFTQDKYGFTWGAAVIERHCSNEKKGWVLIGLRTPKQDLQIYVTRTGKVRIHDAVGQEWLPVLHPVTAKSISLEEDRNG